MGCGFLIKSSKAMVSPHVAIAESKNMNSSHRNQTQDNSSIKTTENSIFFFKFQYFISNLF